MEQLKELKVEQMKLVGAVGKEKTRVRRDGGDQRKDSALVEAEERLANITRRIEQVSTNAGTPTFVTTSPSSPPLSSPSSSSPSSSSKRLSRRLSLAALIPSRLSTSLSSLSTSSTPTTTLSLFLSLSLVPLPDDVALGIPNVVRQIGTVQVDCNGGRQSDKGNGGDGVSCSLADVRRQILLSDQVVAISAEWVFVKRGNASHSEGDGRTRVARADEASVSIWSVVQEEQEKEEGEDERGRSTASTASSPRRCVCGTVEVTLAPGVAAAAKEREKAAGTVGGGGVRGRGREGARRTRRAVPPKVQSFFYQTGREALGEALHVALSVAPGHPLVPLSPTLLQSLPNLLTDLTSPSFLASVQWKGVGSSAGVDRDDGDGDGEGVKGDSDPLFIDCQAFRDKARSVAEAWANPPPDSTPGSAAARPSLTCVSFTRSTNSRPYQEDACFASPHALESLLPCELVPTGRGAEKATGVGPSSTTQTFFAAVYDGHNGRLASEFAQRQVHTYLRYSPAFAPLAGKGAVGDGETPRQLAEREARALSSCLADALLQADASLDHLASLCSIEDGSTAVTVAIRPVSRTISAAWLGDCEAVLCRRGREKLLVPATHTPESDSERQRVESTGGFVLGGKASGGGKARVNGALAVSRALGDHSHRAQVTAEASTLSVALSPDDAFVLLGSDGLFDVVSAKECVSFLLDMAEGRTAEFGRPVPPPGPGDDDDRGSSAKTPVEQERADERGGWRCVETDFLVDEAIRRGSRDNITCVLVVFEWAREKALRRWPSRQGVPLVPLDRPPRP